MNPTQLLDYLTAHPWAGWLLLGVISLLVSRRSQVDAWAEANPRVAGVHKLLRGFGVDPWLVLQSLSLIVRGRLPAPPKSLAPKDDSAPPTPRSGAAPPSAAGLLVFLAALAGAPNLTGCSSASPVGPPCDAATLAGIVAECATRVEIDCVQKDVPEEQCEALKECDARIDARTKECGR